MISQTEENYIKAIFKLSESERDVVGTNLIANEMSTTAASVTDMIKRLSEKAIVNYQKYKGVSLTDKGKVLATNLIRKHRLWECFLVNKLGFGWEEVHDIAEKLEHIQSPELIDRLDDHLGYPKFDPHGDPIPNANGKFTIRNQDKLSDIPEGSSGVVLGVRVHDTVFLKHLNECGIALGTKIKVTKRFEFDYSMLVLIDDDVELKLSDKVCKNIWIKKNQE